MKTFACALLVLLACGAFSAARAQGGMMPLPPPVVEPKASPASASPEAPSLPAAPADPAASADPAAPADPAASETASSDEAEASPAPPEASADPGTSATASTTSPARVRPRMAPGFAPRGAIRDRTGQALVYDGPCWDVGVRYEVVAARAGETHTALQTAYLGKIALQRAHGPGGAEGPSPARLAAMLAEQVEECWADVGEAAGFDDEELARRAQRAVAQVERMKAAVARARGEPRQIAEERSFRTVARVYGADVGKKLAAKLAGQPWVKLTASQSRVSEDTEALVHVLGRVGKADQKRVGSDPLASDPDRALAVGDACGISGAERLGDPHLRAWVDAAGTVHPGQDVSLTVDAALQRDIYRILETSVKKSQSPCGGAAAVIDVATGEVRALVSYPAHAYDLSSHESARLADDARWTPLRFRAVSSQFPPGSTIKPVTLYTSLAQATVTTATRVTCSGTFRKDVPNAFRCWVFNKTGGNHGEESGETALRDSCNIFFFAAGDKLGAAPLIREFAQVGLGITQGTGLIEESPGILPTPEWLAARRPKMKKYQRADAWNYAFGQGELTVTPLQMANLAATLARGRFQQVTLMKSAAGQRVGVERKPGGELDEQWLTTVRRGLWRVVNEKGGTADVARLDLDTAVLCGKTGSAQAVSRVIMRRYAFKLPDGETEAVDAVTLERARADVPAGAKLVSQEVTERYPETEEDELPSHAWFIGYTQDPKTPRGAKPQGPCYALTVLVEYGGAGGQVASPIARAIARRVITGPAPVQAAAPKKDKSKPKEKPKPRAANSERRGSR